MNVSSGILIFSFFSCQSQNLTCVYLVNSVPVISSFLTEYYGAAIRTLQQVNRVVDSLYAKVRPFIMFDYWFVHIDAIQTIKIA